MRATSNAVVIVYLNNFALYFRFVWPVYSMRLCELDSYTVLPK